MAGVEGFHDGHGYAGLLLVMTVAMMATVILVLVTTR